MREPTLTFDWQSLPTIPLERRSYVRRASLRPCSPGRRASDEEACAELWQAVYDYETKGGRRG